MSIPTLPSTHTWVQGGPILDRAGNYALYTSDTNQVWVWNEDTGTQVTNLLDANANPITTVPVVGGRIDGVGVPVAVQLASFSVGQFGPRYYALPIQTIRNANAALAPTDTQVSTLVNTSGSATDVALKAGYAPKTGSTVYETAAHAAATYSLPSGGVAFNLLHRDGSNVVSWTTSNAEVARALGWQVLVSTTGSDDGPMINAALAALPAGGGTVYLTGGNQYNHSTPLVLSDGQFLRGAGASASRLNYTGTSGTYALTVGANGNWGIDGITLTSGANGVGLLQINGGTGNHNGMITRSRFFCSAGTSPAIDINGNVNELTIHHNLFQNGGAVGVVQAAFGANNIRFTNNSIAMLGTGSNGNGLTVAPGCDNWFIAGCNFEGSGTGNVGLQVGGTTATTVISNYAESWKGAAIAANTSTGAFGLTIQGNSVQATSAAAACIVLTSPGPNVGVTCIGNNSGTLGNSGFTSVLIAPGSTKKFFAQGNSSQGASSNIISYANPPLVMLGSAGTSPPTPTSVATGPLTGTVTWGTGTAPAIGAQVQVNYPNQLLTAASVTLTPLNPATAALQPYVHGAATYNGFNIGFGVAPAASQAATTYAVSFTATGY